ncbi:hypothetical protein WD019_17350 [Fictibacillus sp. Mic-4]|uniref:hypothetical protein n=1 Tax=Fictibacillus TaxID=1329200 RepID=UPI000427D3B3|nr:hypothetical protein [Fictibacillus gelatini]
MNINEILQRATTDKEFAEKMKAMVIENAKNRNEDQEWSEVLNCFRSSPEDLASLGGPDSSGDGRFTVITTAGVVTTSAIVTTATTVTAVTITTTATVPFTTAATTTIGPFTTTTY